MPKNILTILGIDSFVGFVIWATDPSFLKIVLGAGILALIALLILSKQGKVSIYGSNLIMGFVIVAHYL